MFKKLTACLLTLVVLLPNILLFNATVAVAASTPEISISNVSGSVGDTVDVPIIISSNPGITALSFSISYDNSMISLIGVSDGGILGTSTPSFGNNYSLIPYTLNWDDLSTTDNYGNGTVATLKFKILESANGTTPISISLNQKSTFNVNLQDVFFSVNNGSISIIPITTTKIEINTVPNKTEYFVNDLLITDGLTLTATYSNGKSETITNGFTCSPTILSSSGTQTISVNYNNKTTSFTVSVVPLEVTSLSVSQLPEKISYFVGETLNVSGLSLSASYNNGTSKEITNGFTCSPTTLSSVGNQFVTVSYGGKTVQYEIVVSEIILSDITVKNLPTKTEYYVGEKIDPNGLVLTGIYNNGSEKDITNGYTISNSSTVFETPGINTISVYYDGKSVDFNVNVIPVEITEITVINLPAKTDYYVDESFDQTGLKLKVSYSNGTNAILEDGYTFSPNIFTSTGTQKVTIEYSNKTTTINVNVSKPNPTKIIVYNSPNKTSYFVGDSFDPTGLSIMVVYDNTTTAIINTGFSITSESFSNSGTKKITIKYNNLSAYFYVDVENVEPISVEIIEIPKAKYYLGETLNTNSIAVRITYNNGTFYETKTGTVRCTPTFLDELGIITISASYEDYSTKKTLYTTFDVEVINPPYTFTLSFDNNGGNGNIPTQSGSIKYTIPKTTPKDFPNTFTYWSPSKSSSSDKKYYPGDSIILDDNLTLYAHWQRPNGSYLSDSGRITFEYSEQEAIYNLSTCVSDLSFEFNSNNTVLKEVTLYNSDGTIVKTYSADSTTGYVSDFSFTIPAGKKYYIGFTSNCKGDWEYTKIMDYLLEPNTVTIIHNPGTLKIDYRENVKLRANVNVELPMYCYVGWFVNGRLEKIVGETDANYDYLWLKDLRKDTIVEAKLVDEDGNVYRDKNGNEICDSETIKVNAGFFKRLIAFIICLFEVMDTIDQ